MKKSLLFLILSIAGCSYGFYCIYKMVFQNQAPFTIECVGVGLNPDTKYAISNSLPKSPGTLVIDYPQGEGIMPGTLGYIVYNHADNSFEFQTGDEIMQPFKQKTDNPFFAFCRTLDEKLFQDPTYFGPNSVISSDILMANGVKCNSIVGDKFSRVSLKLLTFAGKSYLKTSSEGIGVRYLLQAGSLNRISVTCNQSLKNEQSRIYLFENTTSDKCENTIEIFPSSTFNYSYKVLDETNQTIKSGDINNNQFEVGNYLFKISARYTAFDTGLSIVFLFVLLGFQLFLIHTYIKSSAPTVKSIIAIRLMLNCLAFLSIPLYLTALYITPNRWLYLASLLLLNVSFFTSKRILHNFNFNLNKLCETAVWFVVIILPLFMHKFTSNESLFGIPVLHIQKLAILGLIFVAKEEFFKKYRYGYWIRLMLILAYTFVLSLITSDIGSFLYTFIAFLLVEIVKKAVSPKQLLVCFLFLACSIFLFYNVSNNAFADRKFYRIVAPYTAPDSEKLDQADQSDRETYSSLDLIQKNLLAGSVKDLGKIVIPASMRSTSFSDFAFFWSLVFGKSIFAVLFFTIQFLLLYELAFLLFISIREIRVNKTEAFVLPANRESEFVRFLLAFSIVTFTYPVLSNLLLLPLTGQSFPCLSISIIEIIFMILFLIPISSIFTNPKYIQVSNTVAYGYLDVLNSLKFTAVILLSLFVIALTIKGFNIKGNPDNYRWQKLNKESIEYKTENIIASDKPSLIKNALETINSDELISLRKQKKPYLKNLASFYYLNKPYNQIHFGGSYFQNTTRSMADQMSSDSIFSIQKELISGSFQPFGQVFSYFQMVNGKGRLAYTNEFYASIPQNSESINADLSAELSKELYNHILKIGIRTNIGSIMIINNTNGRIIANSTYPLVSEVNSNEIHYNIGSLKKIILAYCALAIDPDYKNKSFKNVSFHDFIKLSDDYYAAALLKDIMLKHEQAFADVLSSDFDLPLISQTEDGYFDKKPDPASYTSPLDKTNEIYRYSIGQQKPYQFIKVIEWYSRIASEKKVLLNYSSREKAYDNLSLPSDEMIFIKDTMNSVLSGTASNVGNSFLQNGIQLTGFIAKTGTAESASKQSNSSSSLIIANPKFTIGIMLNGRIPDNSQKLASKDLMVKIIPILKKYNIL